MKVTLGFITGFIFAATIYWSPQIANRILTMNPPETYAGYPGPKYRNWKKGVEQLKSQKTGIGFVVESGPMTSTGSRGAVFIGHGSTRYVDAYRSPTPGKDAP